MSKNNNPTDVTPLRTPNKFPTVIEALEAADENTPYAFESVSPYYVSGTSFPNPNFTINKPTVEYPISDEDLKIIQKTRQFTSKCKTICDANGTIIALELTLIPIKNEEDKGENGDKNGDKNGDNDDCMIIAQPEPKPIGYVKPKFIKLTEDRWK